MKPSLILATFLAIVSPVYGQDDVRFKRITANGRELEGTEFVYKDLEGYIWIGSFSFDLIRMDGRNVREFSQEVYSDYFKGFRVGFAFEDSKKDLWVGTDHGALLRYDRLKDKFIVANDSATSVKHRISTIVEGFDGSFWIGTMGGGLLRFHPVTKEFKRYVSAQNDEFTIQDNYVTGIERDASGNLWVGTTGGLSRFDSAANNFVRYPLTNSNPEDTYRYRVIRHVLRGGNKLYLSTYGGLQIFDLTSLSSEHFFHNENDKNSLPHNSFFKAAEDKHGAIWLASYGGGLIRFDPVTRKFSSWKNDENDAESLSTNNVFSVDIDRDGLLWAGGADNTICLYNPNAKKFHLLMHHSANPEGLSSGWPISILNDQDSIYWIGFNGNGLNRLNINTGVAKKFINNPADKFSIGDDEVPAIGQDSDKRIWLGLSGAGINMFDPKSGRFTRYEAGGKNSINNNAVSAMMVDKDNFVWMTAYRNGLNIYDIRKNKFRIINDDSLRRASGISLTNTRKIFEWKGDVFFLTQNQIVAFNKKRNTFVKVAQQGDLLSSTWVFIDVNPLSENELLLFTDTEVKLITYADSGHFGLTTLSARNRDEDSYISFAVDARRQVWYVTDNRIGKWNPTTGERRVYYETAGIFKGDLTSVRPDNRGRMFITGTKGLAWFYPDEITDDTLSRKIVFTDFKLYNRSMAIDRPDSLTGFSLSASVSTMQRISLDHDHAFFSLEFSTLEFVNPEKIQYAYKLEGFDKNWVQVGNQNFGSYTNLDPGTYTFYVKCANPDGFWGKPISISIVINPPFWQTWWFIALSVILIAALARYIHNYRLGQSLKMERLRNKIASDLHDEVGSSLTRVTIYSDLLQKENSEAERANYVHRISTLSREVVGTMSDIVWSIDSQSDTVDALLLRMRDFATELLQARNIHLDIKTNGLQLNALVDPALRQNIYLIFKEAVNNIVNHADAGRVTVEIQNDSSTFRMTIADDGKGFVTGDNARGNGLRNMTRRGRAIDGKVSIESDRSGTRVVFVRKNV